MFVLNMLYGIIKTMIEKIKNAIEKALRRYMHDVNKKYKLKKHVPLAWNILQSFLFNDAKRLRPIIFILSFYGHSRKRPAALYKTALSFEFLHSCMLIHDDIIDNSYVRRAHKSVHRSFDEVLRNEKKSGCTGKDLALLVGDILYALAMQTFPAIRHQNFRKKERALELFTCEATYAGIGEFLELVSELKPLHSMQKNTIDTIYNYKTALYTFCAPLKIGALLAGARAQRLERLHTFGVYVGRAFQIHDDILRMSHNYEVYGIFLQL